MKIRCLYILIGCVAALNISAQDISKPVIKKTEVQTPKRTTTTESKERKNKKSMQKSTGINRHKVYCQSKTVTNNDRDSPSLLLDLARSYYEYKTLYGYWQARKIYNKPEVKKIMNGDDYYKLGTLYLYDTVRCDSLDQAKSNFIKSIEFNNNIASKYKLGVIYKKQGNYLDALNLIRDAAQNRYAKAQYELGTYYQYGYCNLDKNEDEAKKWYKLASEQGHAIATFKLREYTDNEKDYFILYNKAADLAIKEENYELCYEIADRFRYRSKKKEAGRLYEIIASNKTYLSCGAAYQLAYCYLPNLTTSLSYHSPKLDMYISGYGIDIEKAIKWLQFSAECGYPDAISLLGNMYETGTLVPKDIKKAKNIYLNNMKGISEENHINLGRIFEQEDNYVKAAIHYQKGGLEIKLNEFDNFKFQRKEAVYYNRVLRTLISNAKSGDKESISALNELQVKW